MLGTMIRRNAVQRLAPTVWAAFLLLAESLEDGDDRSHDQRQRHEHGREHHARHREDDLDAMPLQPSAGGCVDAVHEDEGEADDHRRHRDRQVDGGRQ